MVCPITQGDHNKHPLIGKIHCSCKIYFDTTISHKSSISNIVINETITKITTVSTKMFIRMLLLESSSVHLQVDVTAMQT